jgi:hypothetical protein
MEMPLPQVTEQSDLGPNFRTFFLGKIPRKIPRKIFSQKMLGKYVIFRGKSFEKSFFQEIPRNFPRKKCMKNPTWSQIYEPVSDGNCGKT